MAPSKTPARSASTIPTATYRAIIRHPRLTIVGFVLFGTGLGFRHVAKSMRDNDIRQKNSPNGHLYVSVDRSGGGV